MRVEKMDDKRERRLLIGMIVDKAVVGKISTKWEEHGLFSSRWSNIIGAWCVDYYLKYKKAPNKAIEGMFESWSEESPDKDVVRLVEKFLTQLANQYASLRKETNSDYLIDLAGKYFERVKLLKLAELIAGDIDSGKLARASKRVDTFRHVEIGANAGIDVLHDKEARRRAMEVSKSKPLITIPGALGKFFGNSLKRDCFIAIEGAEKRGKSWMLLWLAWEGMLQGRRVAFIEAGDMSEAQVLDRWMIRNSVHPMNPKKVKIPTYIEFDSGSKYATVTHKTKRFTKPLNLKKVDRDFAALIEKTNSHDETLLRLSVHPVHTLSVHGIQSILQTWERELWVPDIIVLDYADLLSPLPGYSEHRDRIEATWAALRGLNLSTHSLLITASQIKAAAYKQETLDLESFSGNKLKRAYTTGTIGINQTEGEKRNGVMRWNWIVSRGQAYDGERCCHVAGCLDIGNPIMLSTF